MEPPHGNAELPDGNVELPITAHSWEMGPMAIPGSAEGHLPPACSPACAGEGHAIACAFPVPLATQPPSFRGLKLPGQSPVAALVSPRFGPHTAWQPHPLRAPHGFGGHVKHRQSPGAGGPSAARGQDPALLPGPGAHTRVLGPAQGTGVNWGLSSKDWDGSKGPASSAVVAQGLPSVMRREHRGCDPAALGTPLLWAPPAPLRSCSGR